MGLRVRRDGGATIKDLRGSPCLLSPPGCGWARWLQTKQSGSSGDFPSATCASLPSTFPDSRQRAYAKSQSPSKCSATNWTTTTTDSARGRASGPSLRSRVRSSEQAGGPPHGQRGRGCLSYFSTVSGTVYVGCSPRGYGGSSSSLSLKGSAKREKLLMDFSNRKGDFLLKVAKNAFRRLEPSETPPTTIDGFGGRALFSRTYVERNGGFAGQRDLGLMMWLLCQICDMMIRKELKRLALALVTIEQVAQDGGKWEVGWILSLQEDPPPGMFTSRPSSTNPRLRAFSPLCPPVWEAWVFGQKAPSSSGKLRRAAPPQPPKVRFWFLVLIGSHSPRGTR